MALGISKTVRPNVTGLGTVAGCFEVAFALFIGFSTGASVQGGDASISVALETDEFTMSSCKCYKPAEASATTESATTEK